MHENTTHRPKRPPVACHASCSGLPVGADSPDGDFERFIRNLVRRRLARASLDGSDGPGPSPRGVMEPPEDPPRIALACPSAPDSWNGQGEHAPLPRPRRLL